MPTPQYTHTRCEVTFHSDTDFDGTLGLDPHPVLGRVQGVSTSKSFGAASGSFSVTLKKPQALTGASYQKHKIRATLEIAIVGVAVTLDMDGGSCRDARVLVGAAAPTPIRILDAENCLNGAALDDEVLAKAMDAAAASVSPIDDVRGTADYRREMTKVCLKRAVKAAAAGEQSVNTTGGDE